MTKLSNIINIQGYFTNLDNFNRITFIFLDDYESKISDKNQSFTKSYLLQKEKNIIGHSPISSDKKYFYVKCKNQKVGYIDSIPHPLINLRQHKINLEVELKLYDFYRAGVRTNGWYLDLKKASLLEY